MFQQSDDPEARGTACYQLAQVALGMAAMQVQEEYVAMQAEEIQALLKEQTVDERKATAEKHLEIVVEQFADLPGRRGTLGGTAARDLFELRKLQIGCVAPEVTGADIDGTEFSREDYRGKVVVLDFWGDW